MRGNRLALAFTEDRLADSYQFIANIFRQRGAYGRFKNFLEHKGCLEAWYDYESKSTELALREWAAEEGIPIAEGSGQNAG